jgi:hypothetical protein
VQLEALVADSSLMTARVLSLPYRGSGVSVTPYRHVALWFDALWLVHPGLLTRDADAEPHLEPVRSFAALIAVAQLRRSLVPRPEPDHRTRHLN